MRGETEIKRELDALAMERRRLLQQVRDPLAAFDEAQARSVLNSNYRRQEDLQKELAELARPRGAGTVRGGRIITRESLLKSAAEKRAIVIGSAGAISQIRELFKEIAETDSILDRATYYYGPNASTNITVLSPLGDAEDVDESTGSLSGLDTEAALSVTEIQPKAYSRALGVTAESLQMGAVDIESQMPEVFRQSFQRVLHKGMLTGDGESKRMKGIFVSAAAHEAGMEKVSAITITKLAELALKVASKDEPYTIIMSPSIYQAALSDTADTEDIKIYKEGLIRDKSIEGVPVLLDAYAPTAKTSGSILAAACPLQRYAIGVAGELMIKPIDVLQDTKTYFQATMFFSGKQISDTDVYSLAAA